jgi:hypothetical protein
MPSRRHARPSEPLCTRKRVLRDPSGRTPTSGLRATIESVAMLRRFRRHHRPMLPWAFSPRHRVSTCGARTLPARLRRATRSARAAFFRDSPSASEEAPRDPRPRTAERASDEDRPHHHSVATVIGARPKPVPCICHVPVSFLGAPKEPPRSVERAPGCGPNPRVRTRSVVDLAHAEARACRAEAPQGQPVTAPMCVRWPFRSATRPPKRSSRKPSGAVPTSTSRPTEVSHEA